MNGNFAAQDLPEASFPFTIDFFTLDDGGEPLELVHSIRVEGPGVAQIPPLAREHGGPIAARMTFSDGSVQWGGP